MVGKWAAMKTKKGGNPTQDPSGKSNDPTQMTASQLRCSKAGEYLMNTGSIMLIVAILYTSIDWWIHFKDPQVELKQLIGPFLAIVALGFLFIGFFLHVKAQDDGTPMVHTFRVLPFLPITSPTPVLLKSTGKTQEARQANGSQTDSSVNDIDGALPPYDAVYRANR